MHWLMKMYSKKAMSYWFKEGFGLILLNIIERVKRSIGGFTERYSEILSQSFWWLTTIFWGPFFPALSFKTRWYACLRYFIPFPSASVECRGCVGRNVGRCVSRIGFVTSLKNIYIFISYCFFVLSSTQKAQ